ncbi:MAG: NAD(P)-binding protein [Candidatus Moraniibacteriota bacterium]
MKNIETIIIGGGIAGLACAKRLDEAKKDFLLISEDIGGRILTSDDGNVNYGAYFVCEDYNHFLQHVFLGRRIRLSKFLFHKKSRNYLLFSLRSLIYLPQFVRLIFLLRKFRKHFYVFRKKSETISQKQALEEDDYLLQLFKTKVEDFIKKHQLEELTRNIIAQSLNACTFSPISDMNAFNYLQFSLPLIVPFYEFRFKKDSMIARFKNKIIIDCVIKIEKEKNNYIVCTKTATYKTKNVVLATQIETSRKLIKIKEKINKPVDAHMFHVKGKPNFKIKKGEFQMFDPNMDTLAISRQLDGTYLYYSKKQKPNFREFFTEASVIEHKFWKPVGNINGHSLIEANVDDNLYLIGDYNVVGLEDAFITGIYAANKIVEK